MGVKKENSGKREDTMNGPLIQVEKEQLDHQRARLEEIIRDDMVSPKMKSDLRRLLDDIGVRLWELSQPNPSHPKYTHH